MQKGERVVIATQIQTHTKTQNHPTERYPQERWIDFHDIWGFSQQNQQEQEQMG